MSSAAVDRAREARELFRSARSGVLSSHSVKFPGFPYGSALPHLADLSGRPVVLISHLAEHTHNVEADPRASFVVSASGADLQTSARAALLGEAHPIEDPGSIQTRYLRFFPEHAQYLQIGGFRFWTIEPFQVRYIAGFGSLHWIEGASFLAWSDFLVELESSALEHMNLDHREALLAYCRHRYGFDPQQVEMIGIDSDGFDVRADERLLRFPFVEAVTDAVQLRAALALMARDARG